MPEPPKYLKPILEALLRDPSELPPIQLHAVREKAQVLRNAAISSIGDVRDVLEKDMDRLARWDKLQ